MEGRMDGRIEGEVQRTEGVSKGLIEGGKKKCARRRYRERDEVMWVDRKSTRLNSSHL